MISTNNLTMYPIVCPLCGTKGTSKHGRDADNEARHTLCPSCSELYVCRLNHPDDPLEACHACDGYDVYAWEHLSCEVYAITCAACGQPGLSRYEQYSDEEKCICTPCQAWYDDINARKEVRQVIWNGWIDPDSEEAGY